MMTQNYADQHRRRIFTAVLILGILITGLSGCGQSPNAAATTAPTPIPDVSVCADGCDFITIQAAIDAETTTAGKIIGVLDGIHTEAGILVSKNVIIQGKGPAETIVQANPNPDEALDRVFTIMSGVTATIRGMTIRYGNPKTEPESGGGVRNEGTLTLENAVISENSGGAGGGILTDGTLTLVNSTVRNNEARGGGDALLECDTGGGIKIMAGDVTIINSTISENRARGKGGGIHVACNGVLQLVNSTISGNFTNNTGGGIYLNGVGNLIQSTISSNNANSGGGISFSGSGEKDLIRGQLNFTNTIIASNTARLEKYGVPDCLMGDLGTIATNSGNWVGDGSCSPAFSGDPMLEPLADNGGDTQTHALLPGSPAVDALKLEDCIQKTDQRGEPRIGSCDIGAYELQSE